MHNKVGVKNITVVIIIIMLTIVVLACKNRREIVWIEDVNPISRVNTDMKVVAIACNVYEGGREIEKIINILGEENIKISFFIGGIWASKNSGTLKLMRNEGHDIQNHGYYHKLPSTINVQRNIKEIKDTEELIYNITGVRTKLFEPPSGDYDENTLSIVHSLNYKMVTWNVDTIDWRKDATRDLILKRIDKKLQPGSIILIHPKPVTADSFEDILELIKSKGFQITTVEKLIENE